MKYTMFVIVVEKEKMNGNVDRIVSSKLVYFCTLHKELSAYDNYMTYLASFIINSLEFPSLPFSSLNFTFDFYFLFLIWSVLDLSYSYV